MADIELVIKIPKEVKNRLCFGVTYAEDIRKICEVLNNGTPLPKGHGRLIDADVFIDNYAECGWIDDIKVNEFNAITPTILEADKESE